MQNLAKIQLALILFASNLLLLGSIQIDFDKVFNKIALSIVKNKNPSHSFSSSLFVSIIYERLSPSELTF